MSKPHFPTPYPSDTVMLRDWRARNTLAVLRAKNTSSWRGVANGLRDEFSCGYLNKVANGKAHASVKLWRRLRPHRKRTFDENALEWDVWRPAMQGAVEQRLALIAQRSQRPAAHAMPILVSLNV